MAEDVARQLIGTWKMLSAVREEKPSGVKTDLFGPDPVGFLNYSPDGRMLTLIVRGGRERPAGHPISTQDAAGLLRSMMSYAGTWEVKGEEVFHHVEASSNELWTGSVQQRFYRFDGDRLALSTPVSPDPVDGKISVRSMLWERVK